MNKIDKLFNEFVDKINSMTKEEIYLNIKKSFDKVPIDTQKSIAAFFGKFNYWGKIDLENNNYEALYEKANTLKENINQFKWLYNILKDYKSKKLLYGILNNWFCYDFNTVNSCLGTPYKHYFDLDIISNCQDEVVVDLGAYTGDTILDYIDTYGEDSYKKIYCYDITDEVFPYLKNNLSKYQNIIYRKKAISNKIGNLYLEANPFSISANKVSENGDILLESTTLDEDIKEKVSMIKMDIEGNEKNALLGSINHIKNDKPKLLISVYHNNNHLWEIPKLINEINPNYNYYLRCYGNCIYPTEIVLFAIPKI